MPEQVKAAQQIAESQYVFGILFIFLFFGVTVAATKLFNDLKAENTRREQELKGLYDEHRQESKEREAKLMIQLEKQNGTHEKTSETLEKIQLGMTALEINMQQNFKDIQQNFKEVWTAIHDRRGIEK